MRPEKIDKLAREITTLAAREEPSGPAVPLMTADQTADSSTAPTTKPAPEPTPSPPDDANSNHKVRLELGGRGSGAESGA